MLKFRSVAFSLLIPLILGAYQILMPSAVGPAFLSSDAHAQGAAKKEQKGKYVVTWVKNDGQWQVFTDMFSPDAQ
jgi:hypothetical protein